MSDKNERRLDSVYKVAVTIMLPVLGFFLWRLVNQIDQTAERQYKVEITVVGIQKDVDKLNAFQERSINMFVEYFNKKDKEIRDKLDTK